MVQALIEDFATVSEELAEGIEMAEEAGDAPTADMFTGFKADLEKHMWMRSFQSVIQQNAPVLPLYLQELRVPVIMPCAL